MFLEHYGLREQPFGVTPDPRYLYFSAMHREALASLFYGIETGCGFLTLIAPPGMGKTTLLLHLLERLRKTARTVFLFQTQCDSREFFRYLLTDLGIDASNQNMAHMHESLNFVLLSNAQMGRRFVLVIDEAQNLKKPVLETVRLLSDFETPSSKLLQIVLCGQPQLADRLSQPDLMQLRQRISIFSRLHPFTRVEVMHYIHHRLNVAGYAGPALFSYDAIDQIAAHSDGIPRNINNICFNALTLGYAKRQEQIDGATISEVLADLDMDILKSQSVAPPIATQDLTSSADALEPTDEATYQDFHSAARAAWMKGVEGGAMEGQGESDSIPTTSGGDRDSLGADSQRDSSDLAAAGLPLEPKAASTKDGVANPGSVQTVPTDRRVPRMPDRAKTQVEKARNGEPRSPNSAGKIRSDLKETPVKYGAQTREWLAEPAIPVRRPTATGLGPSIIPIDDRHGQITYSSDVVQEEFCGLRIANFRQTIRSQSSFDGRAESEEYLEVAAPEASNHTPDRAKIDDAAQSSVPTPAVKFQALPNKTTRSSAGPTTQKVPGGRQAHESEPQKQWKLIATCRRAVYSWSKRSFILPP